MVLVTMMPVMEKMHERTSKNQKVGKYPQKMCSVLREQKKCGDSEKANQYPSATTVLLLMGTRLWCVIHLQLLCLIDTAHAMGQ